MLINLALTGDNHFNVARRSDEAKRILLWMLDDWKQRRVHFIGFAGDTMDGPMSEFDRVWLCDYLRACADIAPVTVIYGNHCAPYSLDNFGKLKTRYPLIVASHPDVHVIDTEAGKLAVVAVPFPWKAHLLAQVGPVAPEDADRIAEQELAKIFLGLGIKVRALGLPTVALIHGTIRGSKINDDQPCRPLGVELPLEDLAQIGADLTICGHIHLQQHFSFNGRDFVVPGSPYFVDYGEARYGKGYVWAEIGN